jgi:hypothetical protein
LSLTKISPTSGSMAGGTSVALTGWNFSGVTSVKFNGVNATSFTINSAGSITATTPASASSGLVNVSVSDGSTTSTLSNAFYYEESYDSALAVYLDPYNIDGAGTAANSTLTNTTWAGIKSSGALINFNYSTASSGWDGSGTTASPYRLKFDGTNDSVSLGTASSTLASVQSISLWFRASSLVGQRGLFHNGGHSMWGQNAELYLLNGVLTAHGYGSTVSTGISANTWYHAVMTLSGSTLELYLNGSKIGQQSVGTVFSNNSTARLATSRDGDGYFLSGDIAEFRAYTSVLSASNITSLYNSTRGKFGL